MNSLKDLKVKLFADGADKAGMPQLNANPVSITSNPNLLSEAGLQPSFSAFSPLVLPAMVSQFNSWSTADWVSFTCILVALSALSWFFPRRLKKITIALFPPKIALEFFQTCRGARLRHGNAPKRRRFRQKPHFSAGNLAEAADIILRESKHV